MSEWSEAAMERWALYLDEVRDALAAAGMREVDAVIGDLEEHATREFAGASSEVDADRMSALIARLGTPAEIAASAIGADAVAAGVGARSSGPPRTTGTVGGQVLAYSSLALLIVGFLVPASAAGAITLSFVVASVGFRGLREGMPSAARIALYPALVVGTAAIVAIVLFWPFALALPIAATGGWIEMALRDRGDMAGFGTSRYWAAVWATTTLVSGIWWLALRGILKRRPRPLRWLFEPFAGLRTR